MKGNSPMINNKLDNCCSSWWKMDLKGKETAQQWLEKKW
jgi:hypothetical protein